MPRHSPTPPPAAALVTQQAMVVQFVTGLKTPCDPTCTCQHLARALLGCACEAAVGGERGSKVLLNFLQLLPGLAAALSSREWESGKGHNHSARHATLDLYNKLVVNPLCAKLSSEEPAVAAAARSEAVAAALAASRSGVARELDVVIPMLLARLSVVIQELKAADATLLGKAPADAERLFHWFSAAHPCRLPDFLHEVQLTCCWVTALARIWPGSILAALSGIGLAAADTLLLCAKYLELVSRMHRFNQQRQQEHQQQQHSQQQQQQSKPQQQLQLLPLPAADITAAVLHTASLLLADLGKHIEDNTSPQGVVGLLLKPQVLHQTALVVAALFGSQLQLNLLHGLQQQDSSSGSGSGGSSGSSSDSSSGSSSGPPPAAAAVAEQAEGVLLCHAQHFVQPNKPLVLLQPSISSPIVRSWLQHFEYSWGEVLPVQQLPHIAAAIAAAEEASAPQQHPSTSTAAQECQPYKLLSPEHCFQHAATAGDSSTAVGAAGSDGSGSSTNSTINSRCCGLVDTQLCITSVDAAARLLSLGHRQQQGANSMPVRKQLPLCQLTGNSPGMQRVPVLLLPSAVAALWLMGPAALPAAFSCILSASARVASGWCQDSESLPCAVCADLMSPHVWPTVGLLSVLLQQVTTAGDKIHSLAESHSGSGSSGSDSSGGPTAEAADTTVADAVAACDADGLPKILESAASLLRAALRLATPRGVPFKLLPQQLQQVSLSVQIMEAAVRCHVRLRQMVSQHGSDAAAATAAGFGVELLLPAAAGICSIAMYVAQVTYSATPSAMTTEVQQVLQAVMSLHLTTLSTAQGQPGAAVSMVVVGCVKTHFLLLEHAAGAAAAGAAQPLSAAVAAGWFLLGRCLLQVAEQLELCLVQPDSYQLSDWLQTSARVWNCCSSTVDDGDMRHQLKQLVNALSLLADCRELWQLSLAHTAAGIDSSSSSTATLLVRYELRVMTALQCLEEDVCKPFTTLRDPLVLAALQDLASPAHQKQLQQHEGPAWQAVRALSAARSGLKRAGGNLCAALPNRYFCNNPGCRNAGGVSAGFGLVRGAACVCGGCVGSQGAAGVAAAPQEAVAARYCSVACQQQHWPEHKQKCPSKRRTRGEWTPP